MLKRRWKDLDDEEVAIGLLGLVWGHCAPLESCQGISAMQGAGRGTFIRSHIDNYSEYCFRRQVIVESIVFCCRQRQLRVAGNLIVDDVLFTVDRSDKMNAKTKITHILLI